MRIRPEAVSRDATICKPPKFEWLNQYASIADPSSSLKAFPETLIESWEAKQLEHLLDVTHAIGEYRLVFKQGEPFKPVTLRVHGDPISIIGKVLDQNRRSYTKINDFVRISSGMVSF
jgi:hypothetical protein